MNNTKALNLNGRIYSAIVKLSSKTGADLNTVKRLTGSCISIGENKTGNIILVRSNVIGVMVESFKGDRVSDLCIDSILVKGVTL